MLFESKIPRGSIDAEPVLIILMGILVIALIALIVRSVIRREKAMIRVRRDTPHEIASYESRWRNARGA